MNRRNKKLIIGFLLIVLIVVLALAVVNANSGGKKINTSTQDSQLSASENKFVLGEYPINEVPLYGGITIGSMKYFVNENSTNVYDKFFGEKRNYYNVVFETKDAKDKVFDFYRSKMSSINQENQNDDTIEGNINDYRVSISNYGYEDFYLQVHLPSESFSKINKYYKDYSEFVEIADNWIEYENSYGLLNQKSGEIEYTQWFQVDTSIYDKNSPMKTNPVGGYYDIYKEKYKNKQDFDFDDKNGILTWTDDKFSVTASFTVDHGRIYLMFRKPME